MPEKEDVIYESIRKMGAAHEQEVKGGIDAIVENLSKGMMPKDVLGISTKNTEALYADGYQLYNIGKYEEAKKVFLALFVGNPMDVRYPFGIAAACHMMKDFENAASWYFKTSLFDPDNPIPYYHASDCHLRSNDLVSALASLRLTVKRCGEKQEYKIIRERAQMTIDSLIKTHEAGGIAPTSLGEDDGPHLNEK